MGLFTNIFLFYMCVSVACVFYDPNLILGETPVTESVVSFFSTEVDVNGNPVLNDVLNNEFSTGNNISAEDRLLGEGRTTDRDSTASTNIFLSVIDPIWNALGYIELFFRLLFSIPIILAAVNAPYVIVWIFGVPASFLGLLSLIAMIRGFS